MPEVRELFFFYWVIKDFIEYSHRKSFSLDILQLWVDAKEEEENGTIALPEHVVEVTKQGMVFPLTKSMAHLTRGDKIYAVPTLHQTLEGTEKEMDICQTAGLVLQNVFKHPRLVCLDLKEVILHALLAHCSPNIYTINDWFETICKVDKKTRKFKIVLAFQFESHVLAFCSYDNNVRASRQSAEDEICDHDPLVNFHGWLEKLVTALETRWRQQEMLNLKLHGSGSKPKARTKNDKEMEILAEMQEKREKALKAVEDANNSIPAKKTSAKQESKKSKPCISSKKKTTKKAETKARQQKETKATPRRRKLPPNKIIKFLILCFKEKDTTLKPELKTPKPKKN
ncbi:uncharacterized protein EV420DRAFT_1484775 [Desarmillaria tabescens]|uniref:Uncharacterized protein n=1 Tax=Armillaria tabescens TaxID=1929756 RepID=A0AA39JKG7_ARMTA|nr:uncharacterized protein EV420DRAFT_1484775 [Desarmillaria tabescens]KAK0444293.1 hypothetical protein EV420DRAFT_1484775 [Desarmillaria tabescens]